MTRTVIGPDDVDPTEPDADTLVGATLISGNDLPTITTAPDDVPMMVKSIRLPATLYDAAEALHHPQGFSGVVRDALAAHLGHTTADDVEHALTVLQAAAARLRAARGVHHR